MARRAAEQDIEWLALTARGTVTGTVRFAKACAAHGVRPICDVDLAVAASGWPEGTERRRTPVRGGAHVVEAPFRVAILVRDAKGRVRLCRLVSAAHTYAGDNPGSAG
ncbi:PHP domain-containing protein [Streptomyces sp. enrichment culture]|uniref:PHP domain-containing protein n=1 Tax=Streptomyces sp. enrichment culture TaxID=1795815 RepID=UPI003F566590